ncbi:MAG: type II toxin-antitoxin system HicA family toxin [Ignavibacteriae bacterium]|nr:type II toxin-antitoxin system HicA family toxin [Ignavibacteriota bacterium]
MATYNYKQLRKALRKAGFRMIRSEKHETWEKVVENGDILQVRVSHKGHRDIPKGTFYEMLRQMGITEIEFRELI